MLHRRIWAPADLGAPVLRSLECTRGNSGYECGSLAPQERMRHNIISIDAQAQQQHDAYSALCKLDPTANPIECPKVLLYGSSLGVVTSAALLPDGTSGSGHAALQVHGNGVHTCTCIIDAMPQPHYRDEPHAYYDGS